MDNENWLPKIDMATCTGCGDCVTVCPTGALGLRGGKAALVNPDACTYTAECEVICPVAAIALPYQVIMESH